MEKRKKTSGFRRRKWRRMPPDAEMTSSLSESVDHVDMIAPKPEKQLDPRLKDLRLRGPTIADLKKWPILTELSEPLLSKVRAAYVCGELGDQAFVVTRDDTVYAIGNNLCGEEVQPPGNSFFPRKVPEFSGKDIQMFKYWNRCGIIVLGATDLVYVPNDKWACEARNCPLRIVQISSRTHNILALTDCGKVYKLHERDGSMIHESLKLPADISISQIDCTASSCFMLTRCGTVYSFKTECGAYTYQSYETVHLIQSLHNIEKIACGKDHVLALSYDNQVYSWGQNDYGQLGRSGEPTEPSRVTVTHIGPVFDIAATNSCDISVAAAGWSYIFMWGKCGGLTITVPFMTRYETIHEVFCFHAMPRVMHQPLFIEKESASDEDVKESLQLLIDDPITSDFVIQIGEKQIHVHKMILKLRSVYFNKMFQTGWKENDNNILCHDEFSFDTYKEYLRFLYTGELDVSPVDAADLLLLADCYSENRLKRACLQIIVRSLTVTEVMYFYNIATRANSQDLVDSCFQFALNHMNDVVQSEAFSMLDDESKLVFLMKAAKQNVYKT